MLDSFATRGPWGLGFRGLRFWGLGFRGLGFRGLRFWGFRGLGFRGLRFWGLGWFRAHVLVISGVTRNVGNKFRYLS